MGSLNRVDTELIDALRLSFQDRSPKDINVIYSYLRSIESLSRIRENSLKELCQRVRYETYPPESTIYLRGQLITDWYLLLSGSVLVDSSLYLPQSVFGTRAPGSFYRHNDCLTLEFSELVAVSYPSLTSIPSGTHISLALGGNQGLASSLRHQSSMPQDFYGPSTIDTEETSNGTLKAGGAVFTENTNIDSLSGQSVAQQNLSRRVSHASDTSSAYSGSECLSSAQEVASSSSDQAGCTNQGHSLLLGSSASSSECCQFWEQQQNHRRRALDSDEDEDLDSSSGCETHSLRDIFQDCLVKEPDSRTAEDINILMDGVQNLPVFSNLSGAVRRSLCAAMVGRTLKESGKVVLDDGEKINHWSVVLNGLLEVRTPDGTIKELSRGDTFGIIPPDTDEGITFNVGPIEQFHQGVLRTISDDCQLATITQEIFIKLVADEVFYKQSVKEAGHTVVVYEERQDESGKKTKLINQATQEKLISHLVYTSSDLDSMYADDFLLTFRVFLNSARPITERLLAWYDDTSLRPRVTRCVLLWVNNHFRDFETYPYMRQFLAQLDRRWETETNSGGERRLFHLACSSKAKPRQVILNLANQNSPTNNDCQESHTTNESIKKMLPFTMIGGCDSMGLFISEVSPASVAETAGLQRGDQILRINSTNFEHISLKDGLDVLYKASGYQEVRISVRYNPFYFYKMVEYLKEQTYMRDRFDSMTSPRRFGAEFQHRASISPLSPCSQTNYFTTRSAKKTRSPSIDISHVSPSPTDNNRGGGMVHSQSHTTQLINAIQQRRQKQGADPQNFFPPTLIEQCSSELDERCLSPPKATGRSRSTHNSPTRMLVNPEPNDASLGSARKNRPSKIPLVVSPLGGTSVTSPTDIPAPKLVSSCEEPVQVILLWCNVPGSNKSMNKLILISPRCTAKELVEKGIKEFSIVDATSGQYGLYLVTVASDKQGESICQKRLSDSENELLNQLTLNSRYYLKHTTSQEALISKETAREIARESRISLLDLSPLDLAVQLTKEDYEAIKAIEAAEYLDLIFNLSISSEGNSFGTGTENLESFIRLVTKRDHWAPSELCSEPNIKTRVKMLKRFIRIGKHLRDMRNFNSLFCLINSLDLYTGRQLKQTWDKLPANYQRLYHDLHRIIETTRNFQQYRDCLKDENNAPAIPYLPIILKDLKFIHLGNNTFTDRGLVNFEKLRQLAREIRSHVRLTGGDFDPAIILQGRQTISFSENGSFFISDNRLGCGQSTMRKNKRRTPLPFTSSMLKKCWDEWLNILRVRTYFDSLKVTSDPKMFDLMAKRVETVIYTSQNTTPISYSSNTQSTSTLLGLTSTNNILIHGSVSSIKTSDSTESANRCDCNGGSDETDNDTPLPIVIGIRQLRTVPDFKHNSIAMPIPRVNLPNKLSKNDSISNKLNEKDKESDSQTSSSANNPEETIEPDIVTNTTNFPLQSTSSSLSNLKQDNPSTVGSTAAYQRGNRRSVDIPYRHDLPPPPPPPPENRKFIRKPSLPVNMSDLSPAISKSSQLPSYNAYFAEKELRHEKAKSSTPPLASNVMAQPPPVLKLHRELPPNYNSVVSSNPVPGLPPPLPPLLPSLMKPLPHPMLPGLRPQPPIHNVPNLPPPMIQTQQERASLFHQAAIHQKPPAPPARTVTLRESSCSRPSSDRASSQRDSLL